VNDSIQQIINSYDPHAPLSQASTIPSSWYTNEDLFEVETRTVFSNSWQFAARVDQLSNHGNYVTTEIAGEPSLTNVQLSFRRDRHDTVTGFTYNLSRCKAVHFQRVSSIEGSQP